MFDKIVRLIEKTYKVVVIYYVCECGNGIPDIETGFKQARIERESY